MTELSSPSDFLRELYAAAVRAADPGPLVTRVLTSEPLPDAPVWLVGLGKAARAMTAAAVEVLAANGRAPAGGIIVAPESCAPPYPAIRVMAGNHPVPG
ncbi:MAG: DUF4147 domain-containing protein, partial [Gemmatimonadales bacterium]|nr:DUF4147 domain-containing protein [Gemmatimonadales bacterium]